MTQPKTSHVVYALIGLIAAAAGLGAANVDTTPIRDFLLWVIVAGSGWYASLAFGWLRDRVKPLVTNTHWLARFVVWFFADTRTSAVIVFALSSILAALATGGIAYLDGGSSDVISAQVWAFLASQGRYFWTHGLTDAKGSGD